MKSFSSTSAALRVLDRLGMGEPVMAGGRMFRKTPRGLQLITPTRAPSMKRPADGRGYRNSRYGVNIRKDVDHE